MVLVILVTSRVSTSEFTVIFPFLRVVIVVARVSITRVSRYSGVIKSRHFGLFCWMIKHSSSVILSSVWVDEMVDLSFIHIIWVHLNPFAYSSDLIIIILIYFLSGFLVFFPFLLAASSRPIFIRSYLIILFSFSPFPILWGRFLSSSLVLGSIMVLSYSNVFPLNFSAGLAYFGGLLNLSWYGTSIMS